MTKPTITFAQIDKIEFLEETAVLFFSQILDLNYNECFVSDESTLSDFSSCGLPYSADDKDLPLDKLYGQWDRYVINEINTIYGIQLSNTNINIVELLHRIDTRRSLQ